MQALFTQLQMYVHVYTYISLSSAATQGKGMRIAVFVTSGMMYIIISYIIIDGGQESKREGLADVN